MAASVGASDTHMEELVDHGLEMEETGHHGLLSRPSLRETYHRDTLLAPETDFMTDDSSSPACGMDVADRLTYLEQRMQMQEDEIQLLKMALSDVLKRLNISEEQQAVAGRKAPGKASRPASLALPSRPSMGNPSAASLKKNTTLPSSTTAKNYTPPSLSKSAMRSPAGSVCSSRTTRTPSRPTSAASSCSKISHDSKAREPPVCAGTRRVTHCKVTMQIYLSPLSRRTGFSEMDKSAGTVPNTRPTGAPTTPQNKGAPTSDRARPEARKNNLAINIPLQKTMNQNTYSSSDTPSYKNPIKTQSQYFQICY